MSEYGGKRLPAVRTLFEILPKGTEGGKEFARLVDLLLAHEGRRSGTRTLLFNDAAGDFRGLDSASGDAFRREGTTGYQYKFYPSPLSNDHRQHIESSLRRAQERKGDLALSKWILVTPTDFLESSTRKGGGDVAWFEGLRARLHLDFEVEHWGHMALLSLLMATPSLCVFYYPDLVDSDHRLRRTLADTRGRYNRGMLALYRDVQFVGMSVYKPEATRGIAIQDIYIPLTIVPDSTAPDAVDDRLNPLSILQEGRQHVVLGDPGSGKSTLVKFLALSGISPELQRKYAAAPDPRLPVVVILRRYADALKTRPSLALLDYIIESIQADLSLKSADLDFFEHYLESGRTLLFFDGLDELPNPHFKEQVRNRITTLLLTYPGNTSVVTSRIVGYDEPFRFDSADFPHYRLAPLRLPEIERFVTDWYAVRLENQGERKRNVSDLIRIVNDEANEAIRQLASNPLLLTIVTLVHRIDAVLPDERVVLYQKCTETLLNTWHTWKDRESDQRHRSRVERMNRARMEAIAYWMHSNASSPAGTARAVVPHDDLLEYITEHVRTKERTQGHEAEPEDAAVDFLEFVKRRAGLLVEVGDRQYSFVHLTFQEYLAAVHIATTNEAGGAQAIWDTIAGHCTDPKWHEVIRLLVGGLRSPRTQETLVEHLLAATPRGASSLLLGGLLLDGVEAAEDHVSTIVRLLMGTAAASIEVDGCNRILRTIASCYAKQVVTEDILQHAIENPLPPSSRARRGAALLAPALGLRGEKLASAARVSGLSDDMLYMLSLLDGTANTSPPRAVVGRLESLADALSLCIVTSSVGNKAAAVSLAFLASAPVDVSAPLLFRVLLSSFTGGSLLNWGPFHEFLRNAMWLESGRQPAFEPGARVSYRVSRGSEFRDNAKDRVDAALVSLANIGRPKSSDQALWWGRTSLEAKVLANPRMKGVVDALQNIAHADHRIAPNDNDPLTAPSVSTAMALETLRLLVDAPWRICWTSSLSQAYLPDAARRLWIMKGEALRTSLGALNAPATEPWHGYVVGWHLLFQLWSLIYDSRISSLEDDWKCLDPLMAASPTHPAVAIGCTLLGLIHADGSRPVSVMSLTSDGESRALLASAGLLDTE